MSLSLIQFGKFRRVVVCKSGILGWNIILLYDIYSHYMIVEYHMDVVLHSLLSPTM